MWINVNKVQYTVSCDYHDMSWIALPFWLFQAINLLAFSSSSWFSWSLFYSVSFRSQTPRFPHIKDYWAFSSAADTGLKMAHLTNCQFFMHLSRYWSWILSEQRQCSCGSTRQSLSGSADYFDNVMAKFIVNNRSDALKADINFVFYDNILSNNLSTLVDTSHKL